jgi:hypothetical protein
MENGYDAARLKLAESGPSASGPIRQDPAVAVDDRNGGKRTIETLECSESISEGAMFVIEHDEHIGQSSDRPEAIAERRRVG